MTIYAEDIGHYWKTSTSAPDRWIEKTKKLIADAGGTVLAEGFGSETQTGRAAYMLTFQLADQMFRITWPVLPSRTGNMTAAKRQAATMLFHDVKARIMASKVLGARAAFFNWLVLPDGRTAAQASLPELMEQLPAIMVPKALPTPEAGE